MDTQTTAVEVEVEGVTYRAQLAGEEVTISYRQDPLRGGEWAWAGRGTWRRHQIEDCPADLGELVYEVLEIALARELAQGDTDAERAAHMEHGGTHILAAIHALGGDEVRRDIPGGTSYWRMRDGSEVAVGDGGDWDVVAEDEIGQGGEEIGLLRTYHDQQRAAEAGRRGRCA